MKKIVVLGSGNVAGHLCKWIISSGNLLCGIYSRNKIKGKSIADKNNIEYYCSIDEIPKADIYIISVSDNAIKEISEKIIAKDSIVVHTSGGCGINELSPAIENRGVIYPLQTFTSGRELDYNRIPLFIEASNQDSYNSVKVLASDMSNQVFDSDSEKKRKLHISAVFACNFVNHLYSIGSSIIKEMDIPPQIIALLVEETVNKMVAADNPFMTQTGPAVREDYNTIEKHLEALADTDYPRKIYELLTDSIINYKLNGKL